MKTIKTVSKKTVNKRGKMKTVAKKTAHKQSTGVAIQNCSITNTNAANEHTCLAIVALSDAVKANAEAIRGIADALKGSPSTINHGIHIETAPVGRKNERTN